ncbi:MAG: hypothetical protein H7Y20_06445, partial [Bryobacteraceae bacterium]|nr:hypothetical protein [Bryobacteraceae bacterium]
QSENWNLLRGILPGETTHVHMLDGHLNSGGFISTSDATIVIPKRTGDQTFTKNQVKKVSVRKGSKRWRNGAIGGAIGAAAMGTLVGVAGSGVDHSFVAGAVVAYGLIGAGIGALFPGYDTLYRVPRK